VEDYLTEDDQWEALKRWLKQNGPWIVGGVILGAGGLLGYRWYDARVTSRSEHASAQYAELQQALAQNEESSVKELAGGIAEEYPKTPYADHAQFALARAEVEKGELDKAAERLKTLADKSDDDYLRQVAYVRLARVQLAQNKADDALATLEKVELGAFSGMVGEVRGDALLLKGDRKGALTAYRTALLDTGPAASGEGGQLQLKINDLAAPSAAEPAVASAAAPAEPAKVEPAKKEAQK
jgi:predicted negative regulator of RcsB-dependent stress response